MKKPIVLAYYLPQFHEIKENNEWWGTGFTEWVALNRSKQYFKSQNIRFPIMPLGQYTLPDADVMSYQYKLAKENNIDGFFIWDYWFGGGRKILNEPKEMLIKKKEEVNFKYALIWANHSWYNKTLGKLLIKQEYLGKEDYTEYFLECLEHFKSENYLKIDNKPIFGIFMPKDIPDIVTFKSVFDLEAKNNGFGGVYWIIEHGSSELKSELGFDNYLNSTIYFKSRRYKHLYNFIKEQAIKKIGFNRIGPVKYSYKKLVSTFKDFESDETAVIFSGWDTTPRHGYRGTYLCDFNEQTFRIHVENVMSHTKRNNQNVIIIKSWNEWAEGNQMEPDNIFGSCLLSIFSKAYNKYYGGDSNCGI